MGKMNSIIKGLGILTVAMLVASCEESTTDNLARCLEILGSKETSVKDIQTKDLRIDSVLAESRMMHSRIDSLQRVISAIYETDGSDEEAAAPMSEDAIAAAREAMEDSLAAAKEAAQESAAESIAEVTAEPSQESAQEEVREVATPAAEAPSVPAEPVEVASTEAPEATPAVEEPKQEESSAWGVVKGFGKRLIKKVEENPERVIAAAGVAAAGTAFATKAMSCDRYDILVEYRLMGACIEYCGGNSQSAVESCAASIQKWECKEKLKESEAAQRARSCRL